MLQAFDPTIFNPGSVIADKFRVERILGQGSMGVVLLATHLQLDQEVAIKFLLPSGLARSEVEARFAQEARAAVKIKSEHVARVIDVGTLDNGMPFIVMEYLEGADLADYVKKRRPVPFSDAVAFVLQACEALAEAHDAGIVHRDLKLSNLFVASYPDGTPCIKVLDFGISKLIPKGGPSDLAMTATSSVMGSPRYMSPEQMRSTRDVDARSDIWAIGVILYELVSGQPPFDAETMPLLCKQVLEQEPPPLAELRPGTPAALAAVIMRCLEKEPSRRFQDVYELARALAPLAPPEAEQSSSRLARRAMSSRRPTTERWPSAAGPSYTPAAPSVAGRRGARVLVALGLAAVLALSGVIAWRWLADAERQTSAAPEHEELPGARPGAPQPPGLQQGSRGVVVNPAPQPPVVTVPPPSPAVAPADEPARQKRSAAARDGERAPRGGQKRQRSPAAPEAAPTPRRDPSTPAPGVDPLDGRL